MQAQIESQWKRHLEPEFQKGYMKSLREFLRQQLQKGKTVFPHPSEYFAALNHTPWSKVKVVILGQDPYHGTGQAHGFCFSVRPHMTPPPSLKNIFKEIERELHVKQPSHGCLLPWADQGVLLLNTVLTVEAHRAGSHQGKGWEIFTDQIIKRLSEKKEHLVFFLWGSHAQKKEALIDPKRHLILKSSHPSPFSFHRGFWGCNHFIKANQYLKSTHQKPICWQLPEL